MSEGLQDATAREAAIDPTQHVIVRAPAGSGKTTLLVRRYLRLLARVRKPESILAITFTRKAAAEMRSRILQALRTGTSDEAQAARQADARGHWQLLHSPNRLKIQTIDSFALSLARSLPLSSSLRLQMSLTQNPEPLFQQAAAATLELLYDADPAPELQQFVTMMRGDMTSAERQIAAMLGQRDLWLLPIAAFVQAFRDDPESAHGHLQDAVRQVLQRVVAPIVDRLGADAAQTLLDLTQRRDGAPPPHDTASAWRTAAELLLTTGGKLRKRINASSRLDKTDQQLLRDLIDRLAGCEDLLQPLAKLPAVEAADVEELAAAAAVLALSIPRLSEAFTQAGQSDFAELLICATRALGAGDDPSELALALDYRIDHILIDEFQDTSPSQFRLFETLVAGWDAQDASKSFFAVGDPLQSIYRFRGADVELFEAAWHDGLGDLPLTCVTLTTNFRSQAGLVEFCNQTFGALFAAPGRPLAPTSTYGGSVAAQPVEAIVPVTLNSFEDETLANQAITRHVGDLLQRFPQDDIAILVRSRTQLAPLLDALRDGQIEWQAQDIDPLSRFAAVLDLQILTEAVIAPQDRVRLFALLRSPLLGLDLADLNTIAAALNCGDADITSHKRLVDLLAQWTQIAGLSESGRKRLQRAHEVFARLLPARHGVTLSEIIAQLWLHLGGAALYPEQATVTAAMLQLLDDLDGETNVIEQLAQRVAQLHASDAKAARVQVMTIHKAKGLEFAHVVLPRLHSHRADPQRRPAVVARATSAHAPGPPRIRHALRLAEVRKQAARCR